VVIDTLFWDWMCSLSKKWSSFLQTVWMRNDKHVEESDLDLQTSFILPDMKSNSKSTGSFPNRVL
jgi:hypothetical protein